MNKDSKVSQSATAVAKQAQTARRTEKRHVKAAKAKHLVPYQQAVFCVLAFGLLAASIALFFVESDIARPFFEAPALSFNIYRIIVMSLAVVFLLLATKQSWLLGKNVDDNPAESARMTKWLERLQIALPIIAIICTIIQVAWPDVAAVIVRKEDWPMYRNAIFVKCAFELVGMIALIITARHYGKRRQWLGMVTAIAFTITLFLMAGEELSWGQRIVGWGTPNSVAAWNAQGELNFHNAHTQIFQNSLYFAGWLLLIAIPFWRHAIAKLVSKFRPLGFLTDWLPPLSFVFIFAVAFGFGDPLHSETGLYYGSNLFIVIATPIILLAMVIKYAHRRDNQVVWHSLIVTAIFLIVMIANQFFSRLWDVNPGAATEYLELFVTFGIMLWALLVCSRTKSVH